MLRKNLAFFLVSLCVLAEVGWSSTVHAFQVQATAPQIGNIAVRWNKPTVTIYLHQDGAPNVKDGSDIRALREAFKTWSTPKCNNLKFDIQLTSETVFSGRKKDPDDPLSAPLKDGKSIVQFESKTWEFGEQVIIKNATFFTPQTGQLEETDLLFNAVNFKWSANELANTLDIVTVALPRIGQMIGLWYSDVPGSVMHSGFDFRAVDRTLRQDDIAGSCFLYPTTGWKNSPPPKPGTTKPAPEPPKTEEKVISDGGSKNPPTPDTPAGNGDKNGNTNPPTKTGCQISTSNNGPWGLLLFIGFFLLAGWKQKRSSKI